VPEWAYCVRADTLAGLAALAIASPPKPPASGRELSFSFGGSYSCKYQRLLESADLNDVEKARLKRIHESLYPIQLKIGLETKLRLFFDLNRKANQGGARAA